jgi:hypothetical protein
MTKGNDMSPEKQDEKPKVQKVQVARLDANHIYQGIDEIDADELTDRHVRLPNGCDLPPGLHRFDWDQRTFVALQPGEELPQPDPHALSAIACGLIAMQQQSAMLPDETLRWLDWYMQSVDALATMSEETANLVTAFLNRDRS